MAAGTDLSRVFSFTMGSKIEPVPFRVPHDTDALRARIRESGAALVVVDPLSEFIDGKVDQYKSAQVRQAVSSLVALARQEGCAVLVILHLNKGSSSDVQQRREASVAFTQIIRGGLLLGHDPDDPASDDTGARVLATTESNLAKLPASLKLKIAERYVPSDTGSGPIRTAEMIYAGQSSATGRDLLAVAAGEHDRSAEDEAVEFLRTELSVGPRRTTDIETAARSNGISSATLRRARQTLRVVPRKTGGPGTPWELVLPEDSKALMPDEHLTESGDERLTESQTFGRDSEGQQVKGAHGSDDGRLSLIPASEYQDAAEPGATIGYRNRCSCVDGGTDGAGDRCGRCYGHRTTGMQAT
jgi:plasmid stability protein